MDPSGVAATNLLNSPFWGMPYMLCILAMAACCWVGCWFLAKEIFKSKPTKFIAWFVLFSMCAVVVFVNPATPDRVKNAMAKDDLLMLIADWERGDRAAVEKWLSNPPKKFYEQ
jgi:hypothetical protein